MYANFMTTVCMYMYVLYTTCVHESFFFISRSVVRMGGCTFSRYVRVCMWEPFIIVMCIDYSSANKWLQFFIVATAIYFAYVSTEKYEVC